MLPRNYVSHAAGPHAAAASHTLVARAAATPKDDKKKPTKTTAKPKPPPLTTTTVVATSTMLTTTTTMTTTLTVSSATSKRGTTTTASVPSAGSESGKDSVSSGSNHTGLIAGVVAGVIVLVVLIAGLLFRTRRRRDRKAREAEQYQQKIMMQKYSEGSSHGYGDDSDQPLRLQQFSESRLQQLGKQPSWFGKKSPLEYYNQVPPLDELKRQQIDQEQRQSPLTNDLSDSNSPQRGFSSSSGPHAQHVASMAVRNLAPGANESLPTSEFIVLHPTRPSQPQVQFPRINTHAIPRPHSQSQSTSSITPSPASAANNNLRSPFRASTLSPGASSAISPRTSTSSPANNTNSMYNYTPPPPSGEPFKLISLSTLPPPGFYDLLNSDFLRSGKLPGESTSSNPTSPTSPTSPTRPPPPIPRASRPNSAASTPLTTLEVRSDAPDVPPLPRFP